MNRDSISETNPIYEIKLNGKSLASISPHLFVEKLREEIIASLPYIKVIITYHPKTQNQKCSVQLKCFLSSNFSPNQIKNIKKEIQLISSTLQNELVSRIQEARRSAA